MYFKLNSCMPLKKVVSLGSALFAETKSIFRERNTIFFSKIITCDSSIYTMDYPDFLYVQ